MTADSRRQFVLRLRRTSPLHRRELSDDRIGNYRIARSRETGGAFDYDE